MIESKTIPNFKNLLFKNIGNRTHLKKMLKIIFVFNGMSLM